MTPADDALTSLDTVGPPTSLVTVGPPLVKESQGILHEASGIRHCRWTVTVAFMISFAFMITHDEHNTSVSSLPHFYS